LAKVGALLKAFLLPSYTTTMNDQNDDILY